MHIAIIGAGNGGQAIASFLASRGHHINLYNRSLSKLKSIVNNKTIKCFGAKSCTGRISIVTDQISKALTNTDIIIITTTANAHPFIASIAADYLEDGQIVLISPGRTGGAMEFREVLKQRNCSSKVYIVETQSLVYACRIESPGNVRIIGVKDYVPVASYPSQDLKDIIEKIQSLYPSFSPVDNVLHTSFQNIGAIFHPVIMLTNAHLIDRSSKRLFYKEITSSIADFLTKVDKERLSLGKAYGIQLNSIMDWITKAYPYSYGNNLHELIQSNPAYYDILAPNSLSSRYLTEDVPTGLVPYISFGELAKLEMPLMKSLVHISCALLKCNFWEKGRTLHKLGIAGNSLTNIIKSI